MSLLKPYLDSLEYEYSQISIPLSSFGIQDKFLNEEIEVIMTRSLILIKSKKIKEIGAYGEFSKTIIRLKLDEKLNVIGIEKSEGMEFISDYILNQLGNASFFIELLKKFDIPKFKKSDNKKAIDMIRSYNDAYNQRLLTTGIILEVLDIKKVKYGNMEFDIFPSDIPIECIKKDGIIIHALKEGDVIIIHGDLGVNNNTLLKWRYNMVFNLNSSSIDEINKKIGMCRGMHGKTWVITCRGINQEFNLKGNDLLLSLFNVSSISVGSDIPANSKIIFNPRYLYNGLSPIQLGIILPNLVELSGGTVENN